MKPAQFVYHAPRTHDEAVAVLAEVAPADGRVLAGGQSLVPAMALRVAQPAHLVDINGVRTYSAMEVKNDELAIGACVRHAAFHAPVVEGPLGDALTEVVRHIAHYPVRTRGTFCGSIANADPASEWCLVSVTLEAKMRAESVRGMRVIPAPEFFKGMLATGLAPDELLTEVRLPVLTKNVRCGFYELSRRPGDFAIAMAFVCFEMADGVIREPRVGVGGVEDRPRRVTEVERLLAGEKPSPKAFSAAAEAATAAMDPIDTDVSTSTYKRAMAGVCVRRALASAAGMSRPDRTATP